MIHFLATVPRRYDASCYAEHISILCLFFVITYYTKVCNFNYYNTTLISETETENLKLTRKRYQAKQTKQSNTHTRIFIIS